MEKLTAENLKGNWATLLLPIKSNNDIDYSLLSDEVDYMIAAGVDGIYSNGTAGEFHNQTENEFDKINHLLSEKCIKASVRFQIGAGHPSPILSLERVKRSASLHPDAFQVILPDWVVPTAAEQVDFLEQIAIAADTVPIVLYNPPHAKLELTPIQYLNFKHTIPQLIGVKVLSKDINWVNDIKKYAAHLSVFVPGHLLASGVNDKVASGSYSNVACINPAAAQKWWELMHTDMTEALRIQKHILQFFKECILPYQQLEYSNPALDKFLASVGGWLPMGTRLRWPYKWIPEDEVALAKKKAQHLIPEFFQKL